MKVIAFLSQKGGAGKTSLAVHTAVAAYETGLGVVLIDTDPQKSATVWGEARQEPGPVVATADVSDLRRVLDAARIDGMDWRSSMLSPMLPRPPPASPVQPT